MTEESRETTRFDGMLRRVKNHPALAILLVLGLGVVLVGQLTNAISDIRRFLSFAEERTDPGLESTPKPATTLDSCGFYRDVYGTWASWNIYSPAEHGVERFWVACRVQTRIPSRVEAVKTNLKVDESFCAGFETQKCAPSAVVKPGTAVWIAVPVEEDEHERAVRAFRVPSKFELLLADTSEATVQGVLPPIQVR